MRSNLRCGHACRSSLDLRVRSATPRATRLRHERCFHAHSKRRASRHSVKPPTTRCRRHGLFWRVALAPPHSCPLCCLRRRQGSVLAPM